MARQVNQTIDQAEAEAIVPGPIAERPPDCWRASSRCSASTHGGVPTGLCDLQATPIVNVPYQAYYVFING
jgi:hypothetical protein